MIVVKVRDRDIKAAPMGPVTTGSEGLPVRWYFDEAWDDLTKIAVFRVGETYGPDMAILEDVCIVPNQLLVQDNAGENLWIGVYGRDLNGEIAVPTIWTYIRIEDGAVPQTVDPAEPTPEWPQQVQNAADEALRVAHGVAADAAAGEFDGISPEVTIAEITHGHRVTITDREHPVEGQSFDVMDGASAYEQAVAGGYTGTEAQFNAELAAFKDLSEQAASAATAAASSATAAAGSATAAAGSATDAATSASSAESASESATRYASSASSSSSSAFSSAGRASNSASSAYSSAQTAAEQATAASDSATAADGSAKDAEAHAVGKRGGTDVGSSDPAYHNNAKYYAEQAASSASDAVTAKGAAETAQGLAEDAQEAAEQAQSDAEAAAQSVSQSAAQISQNASDISDLKSALSELLPLIKVKSLVFNKYGLNTTDGDTNVRNDRVHSAIAVAKSGDIISVPNGFSFWIAYYTINGFSGNSYDELGKWSKGSATIAHDGLFSINVKKDDESVFTDTECYNLNYRAHLYSTSEECVNDIVFGAGHIETGDDAYMWSLHGNDYDFWAFNPQKTLNTTRWRTENKTLFQKGSTIKVENGYRFYIFTYVDGNVINGTWLTGSYTFSADTIARIIVDTVSSEKVPYTEWPNLNEIISIQDNANIVNNLSSEEELYIGEFINGHLTASGVIDDGFTNYRISTPAIVAFPYGDKTILKITINSGYLFAIRTGATANNLNNNLYWFKNGDTINLPEGCNYYAFSICRDSDHPDHTDIPITPADDVGLKVSIQKNISDVVTRNADAENILSNARLFFSANELNTINKYAIIGHTSDCHGDYTRVNNFLSFCDSCGADVACITGDIVSYKPSQQIKWFNDLLLKHDVLPAVCTGNHDVYGNTLTDDDIYNFMFADVAEKIGNTTGKTWYYTDITKKKIRIISVNLYQYGGENRWYTHFTDEQLAWIINTMASTPSGYGIIILTHASQVNLDNAKDSNYDEFFQDMRLYNNTHNSVSGGVPLYDIVDTFISRTTLNKTYAQTGTPSSITVSADFTNVDTSVEFIAHLTGHFHQDSICYVPNRTNQQLMLNVTCTNAIYGGTEYPYLADLQDQARYNMDVTQDAFNVYIIDRDNKTVKVTRIGSNKTYQMKNRQYMEIPYLKH